MIVRPALALLALCALASAAFAQVIDRPISGDPIRIDSGKVAGRTLASGVKTYLGIPYAAPPLRELRWREPQPVKLWAGVLYAANFGPMCVQGMRGPGQNHYFGAEPVSEDCLTVNVWAPRSARTDAKRPVIVWIYGGGFSGGSSALKWTNGEALARKGVVFVSLNYRVGPLGFMAHPELTAESPNHASGDYGFLDQVAALHWVQRNIARFGGDPANVTLMGQSAGSMSLSALQASPLAKGLFKRAIGESGSVLSDDAGAMAPREEAEKVGLAIQAALGAKSLADLRSLPADRISQVRGARTGPDVDGYFMPKPPQEIFAKGEASDAGLLIGFTRDEGFSPLNGSTSAADYEAKARQLYGDKAEEVLSRYPASAADWRKSAKEAGRDLSLGVSMRRWAAGQGVHGKQPVYAYLFSRVHPYVPGIRFIDHDPQTAGAYHAGDIVYFTGNLDAFNVYRTTRNWTPWDRTLGGRMTDMVVAFARTGNPGTAAVAPPRYDPRDEQVVELGDSIRVIPWPNRQNLDALDKLHAPPPPRAANPPASPNLETNAGPRF